MAGFGHIVSKVNVSGTITDTVVFADTTAGTSTSLTVTGTTADDVAQAIKALVTNATATVGTSGHLIGINAVATDGVTGRISLYGAEGRVDGRSTEAAASHQYVGTLGRANFQGASLSNSVIVAGLMATTTIYQGDGTTPLTNGIAAGVYVPAIVGGAAKYGVYVAGAADVSFFNGGIASGGTISTTNPLTPMGYGTGAGGTVTQITSKATGVTLNKASGQITMHNAALGAAAEVTFVVTNSAVTATDVVVVNHASAGTAGAYLVGVSAVGAGSFSITVSNVSGGSLSEAIVLNFVVLKGASS